MVRLHLGCGHLFLPGRINIDSHCLAVADLKASCLSLPLAEQSVTSIEAYHVIEHLGYVGACYALAEWYACLVPNGKLIIETPDLIASLQALLRCQDDESAGAALNWIFGHETPGWNHLMLFTPELLQRQMSECGFADIRLLEPRTHLYGPGFRLEARREGHPVHRVLARVRHRIEVQGLRPANQLAALELEREFLAGWLRLCDLCPEDETENILSALTVSAPLTQLALEEAQNLGLTLCHPERWLKTCETLVGIGFQDLLWRHALSGAVVRDEATIEDAWSATRKRGLELARRVAADPSCAAAQAARLLPNDGCESQRSPPQLFLRQHLAQVALEWSSRGIRHLLDGQDGQPLLERAAAIGLDSYYAVWNLAVLATRRNDLPRAIHFYESLLGLGSPGSEQQVRLELAACYLHLGRPDRAAALAHGEQDPVSGLLLRPLHEVRLRTRPVLHGEGYSAPPND